MREKDAERKLCVEEVQAQCEEDIKKFMENHQNTLTSALKTARHQQTAEKVRDCHLGTSDLFDWCSEP